MAGTTGLEPATSAVTGQRSNQLSYVPKLNEQLGVAAYSASAFASLRAQEPEIAATGRVYQNSDAPWRVAGRYSASLLDALALKL
jgi:hypothetical protein